MTASRRGLHLTPWVTRLILINGVVLLLLSTVFTAPRFLEALIVEPARIASRPWTLVTSMFVPATLLAWALYTAMLALFGPTVERRLGSKRFLTYYIYCGIGAAVVGLGLASVVGLDAFFGPAGAIYGVGFAFVRARTTAELDTAPAGFSARSLFITAIALHAALGLWTGDGLAQLVPFGGIVAGYLFFRVQSLASREQPVRPVPARRPVVTPMRVEESVPELRQAAAPRSELPPEITSAEVDRVLDKIAQFGIESLSLHERRVLSEASERKRREQA